MRTRVRKRWENDYVPTALLVVLGFLFVCIYILPHLPGSRGYDERQFAYSRMPQSHFLILNGAGEYSEKIQKLFRFDEEAILTDSIKVFDAARSEGRIPMVCLPDWAVLFLELGDSERVEACLQGLDDVEEDLEMRRDLVVAIVEEKELSPDLVDWAYSSFEDGRSGIPEWYFLSKVRGDEAVADWLDREGELIVSRGIEATVTALAVLLVSLGACVWFLIRRKKLLRPRTGRILFRSWRWKVVVREFFFAYLATLIVTGLVSLFLFVSPYDTAVLVISIVFMGVPCLWMVFRLTPSPRAALRVFGLIRPKWSVGSLFLFGLVGVSWLLVEILLLRITDAAALGMEDALRPEFLDRNFAVVNGFVLAVFLAPVCEEMIFRGFLFGGLSARFGGIPSAILTSAVFALVHGYSVVGLIATFGYGLVFCWMFARSGSLWPGILTHGIFNFVVLMQVQGWFSLH